jgi:hypothetical protein
VGRLIPRLNVLPERQLHLWQRLRATPPDFVLYGGTGLALRLGHRQSVDFDFFSARPFRPLELARSIQYLRDQRIAQLAENTLSCDVETEGGPVRITFFGGLTIGQISPPDIAEGNSVAVASLIDLFGTKCATVPQRVELKDYLDIHALLTKTSLTLTQGIAAAAAIYGRQYDPLMTLQALSYFGDLHPVPDEAVTSVLLAAVKEVSLQDLPVIEASSKTVGLDVDDRGAM